MNPIPLIDSHAHLTHDGVYEYVDEILTRAKSAGISSIINICTDIASLSRGLELSLKYPWVHQIAATTPHDVSKTGYSDFDWIAETARNGKLIGLGETGLDYHYTHSPRSLQKEFLIKYLRLCLEFHLPVVIHCREAFDDLFAILDSEYRIPGGYAPGVLHCFTGTMKEAEEVLKRGWMLSLSGIVTFKKSIELQQVAKEVPLSQILIETDTPYLAPQGHRGKMNEPAFLVETAACIASLKKISIDELAQATNANAKSLFHLI